MARDLTKEEIENILEKQNFGQLACTDGDQPYIVPMAFFYSGNVLYCQTMEGKKIDILRKNPRCAFHVEEVSKNNWESVTCEGHFKELQFSQIGDKNTVIAVHSLIEKLSAIQDTMGIHIAFKERGMPDSVTIDGKKSTFFCIVIDTMTGRGK